MDLADEVKIKLERVFPDDSIEIDFSDGKHMAVTIKSRKFIDKSLLDQHKMVYEAVNDLIKEGYLHALKIKTLVK